jgi:L-lactate dehydrogenase (cytochrome)
MHGAALGSTTHERYAHNDVRVREFASLLTRPALRPNRLAHCHSIDDLRQEARRFLPRVVFDFIDGGAGDETTLRRNRQALLELEFVPRVLRDVSEVDTTTEIFGCPSPLPFALAPTGSTGVVRSGGELSVAHGAAAVGIPYALSSYSTESLERVATAATAPLWFQLTPFLDRDWCCELIGRARLAGYGALLVTVDTPVGNARLRDLRNGFTIPPRIRLRTLADGARHARWSWQFIRGDVPRFSLVHGASLSAAFSWDDLAWVSDAWGRPVIVKGVLSSADARDAAAAGAGGIVVSNHGGRHLNGAPATIDVLPEVAAAVGDQIEVVFDSGIRSGVDIARALCSGADACLIGRAYLYGLAAGGQEGVERAIRLLADDFRRTLAILGARSSRDLDGSFLRRL